MPHNPLFRQLLLLAITVGAFIKPCHATLMDGITLRTDTFSVQDTDTLLLDILDAPSIPAPDSGKPVVIFLSGGGWEGQARRTAITDTYPLLPYLVNKGFIGVAADYRCDFKRARKSGDIPDMSIGDIVGAKSLSTPGVTDAINRAVEIAMTDLFNATRHIIDHADEYGADASRIVVIGSSAGAITALTAEHAICSGHKTARKILPRHFNYAAVVPMAGGVWCPDTKSDTLKWGSMPCPILMFHGDKDPIVSYATLPVPERRWTMHGVREIAGQLSRMGVPHTLHTFAGMDHDAAIVPMASNLDDIYNFLTHTVLNSSNHPQVATQASQWATGKGLDTYKTTPVDSLVRRSYMYKIADGDSLRLDVYRKADDTLRPILFYCHGGGWQAGERHDMSLDRLNMTEWFANHGWVVVTLDYRLGFKKAWEDGRIEKDNIIEYIASGQLCNPDVWRVISDAIDMAIDDTTDALAFTIANANAWNADTSRVVAIGGSAGAITLLTLEHRICNSTHPAISSRLPDGFNFAAIVSMAGGVWLNNSEPLQWKQNPCPLIMYHGDNDHIVTYDSAIFPQSGAAQWGSFHIARQLRQMGVPYVLYTVTGGDHAWSANPIVLNREDINNTLHRIIDRQESLQLDTRLTMPGTDRNGGWFARYMAGQEDSLEKNH